MNEAQLAIRAAQAKALAHSGCKMQITANICSPVAIEKDAVNGYQIRIVTRTTPSSGHTVAHIQLDPGQQAVIDAEALCKRINQALKQGKSEVTVQANLSDTHLILHKAQLMAHQEPEQASEPENTSQAALI